MSRYVWAAVIIAAVVVTIFSPHFIPWVVGVWPTPAGTSPWYQFWSGFYIVGLSFVTSTWIRRHNCHVNWCWRLGRFPVVEGKFWVCRHHHPDDQVRHGKVTFEHISEMHEAEKSSA